MIILCLTFTFLIFLYIKTFILDITMQFDILAKLTPKVTTIICHYMKKVLLKKNMIGLDQNSYVNKNDT